MIGKIVTQIPSGAFEAPLISHFRLLGQKVSYDMRKYKITSCLTYFSGNHIFALATDINFVISMALSTLKCLYLSATTSRATICLEFLYVFLFTVFSHSFIP